jgi:hypothetical protein
MNTGIPIILACLLLSLFAPLTISRTDSGGDIILGALDVCRSSGAAISGNDDDIPVMDECPPEVDDLEFAGFCDVSPYLFSPCIFSVQRERPPEI